MTPTPEQITAAARALADHNADVCNVNREDNWMIYGDSFRESAEIALRAAAGTLADAAAIDAQDEPYAYEIGDPCLTQQLVYPAYLARYATDEERALPRVPLYARAASEPKALTLTDEQKNAVQHAEKILRAVKLYGLAALLADRGSEGGE